MNQLLGYCNMDDGHFDYVATSKFKTNQFISGNKNGDMIYISIRPIQEVNIAAKTYTYVFSQNLLHDFNHLRRLYNASFFIDILNRTTTPLKLICGAEYDDNTTYYGSFNASNTNCEASVNLTRILKVNKLIKIRIVQEISQRVAIYGVYPDMIIKLAYSKIARLSHLIFDMSNIDIRSLVYLHMVNIIVQDCHFEMILDPILNIYFKRYNRQFNSRIVMHHSHLCQIVEKEGIYDYIDSNDYIWENIYLMPVKWLNEAMNKSVSIYIWSNYGMWTSGNRLTVDFYRYNRKLVTKAIEQWKDFRVSGNHGHILINNLTNANCTIELISLSQEHLILLTLDRDDKVDVEIFKGKVNLVFTNHDITRSQFYDNYVLSKVICQTISSNVTEDIVSVYDNYNLYLHRYMQTC